MKIRLRIALLTAVAVAITLLFSCSPSPVSVEQRISDFFSSLSGDRSDTYTNLDPSILAYSLPKGFWDSAFSIQAYAPYSYSPNPPNTSDPSNVLLTVSDNRGPGSLGNYKFVMVNIGTGSDNWVIHDLQHPPGTTIFP